MELKEEGRVGFPAGRGQHIQPCWRDLAPAHGSTASRAIARRYSRAVKHPQVSVVARLEARLAWRGDVIADNVAARE